MSLRTHSVTAVPFATLPPFSRADAGVAFGMVAVLAFLWQIGTHHSMHYADSVVPSMTSVYRVTVVGP